MAQQTLSTFDGLLKNVYRGPIIELLNNKTYMLDQIQATNANELGTFTGRNLIFPVHTGRNRGRGATTDGGALATAGSQSAQDATVSIKYFDIGIELTDQVIKQSKTNEGAFTSALEFEMDGATKDLKKDMSRQIYGTGDGLLATVTGTPNGTSITVDSGQYIAVGDPVDILVKSSGATTNGVVGTSVTAVSFTGTAGSSTQAAATLTIANATAGALSSSYGVYLASDRANETDGLRNIVATGRTLHNINSSTYPIWDAVYNSTTYDLSYGNPSEDKIEQLAQAIVQTSGETPEVALTTFGAQRRLGAQYASQKRWNDKNAVNIEGGYSAINVSAGGITVPVVADLDCPNGTLFLLNKGSFAWSELSKMDWLTPPEGGGVFHLKDGSTAGTKVRAWQAWMVWDATLICVAPNRNGKITSIADDIPVPRN